METGEQKCYEDLKYLEKMKLRREFNGYSRNIIWFIVYFFALVLMVTGMILFMIVILSPKRQYWQFSGITMLNIGTFVIFGMMQMMLSKEKNFIKSLGSKKRTFFVALTVSLIGNVFVMIFIFTKGEAAWSYWLSTTIPFLGTLILLIPYIKSSKKDIETSKKEEEKFYIWLEEEKNIIRKNIERNA